MEKAGCQLNSSSYNTIINAYAKVGDVKSAERWLKTMHDNGYEANVRSYSAVIDACAKAGQYAEAEEVYKRMLNDGVAPTIVTLTSLSKAHARSGNWQRVESIMNEFHIHGLKMNEYFLCNLLCAYANAKPQPEAERAANALRKAVQLGLKPDEHVNTAFVRAVGHEWAQSIMQELGLSCSLPAQRVKAQVQSSRPQQQRTNYYQSRNLRSL